MISFLLYSLLVLLTNVAFLTSLPTSFPVVQTNKPSGYSSRPSSLPNMIPTSLPTATAQPTSTFYLTKTVICNHSMSCESNSFEDCSFVSHNFIFQCQNESIPCQFTVGNFSVGPNTNITVNGTCELIVEALYIVLHGNSTIKGPSINLTSAVDIQINGLVASSYLGPLYGVGVPSSSPGIDVYPGQGGTYGGSGGRQCNGSHYSDTTQQVGSVDVLEDLNEPYSFSGPTMGSGGGKIDAGRGGGRVILAAKRCVFVCDLCSIEAEGSEASIATAGAGSGGSITVITAQFLNRGELSVKGGSHFGVVGGGGGGGRISINLLQATKTPYYFNDSSYVIHGGAALNPQPGETNCLNGGAGTLFFRNGMQTSDQASLLISNANITTYASTLIRYLPDQTNVLSVYEQAILASTSNLTLEQRSDCSVDLTYHPVNCSHISLSNASLLITGNFSMKASLESNFITANSLKATLYLLQADYIRLDDAKVSSLDYTSSLVIKSKLLHLAPDSSIEFTNELVIDAVYETHLLGSIEQQPLSGSGITNMTSSYYFYCNVNITAGDNVTMNKIVATNIAVQSNAVVLISGGSIIPPANSDTGCLSSIQSSSLESCISNIANSGLLRYNNTFAITAFDTLIIQSDTIIEASTLFLCADRINIATNSTISASHRGCSSGNGVGAGMSPSNFEGGSGGGFGGYGGNGYGNIVGGVSYFDSFSYFIFSGSGGGCGNNCNITTPYSKGGGVVILVALTELTLYGSVLSNGENGSLNNGAGAGGTVSINAMRLYGEGFMKANGGLGGSGPYPGGGGGGGYIQIYNDGNAKYNHVNMGTYRGVIEVLGGSAGTQNRRRLSNSAATSGSEGYVAMPICPWGQGNVVSEGIICEVCPAGYYKSVNGSEACNKCSPSPPHSYYTAGCTTTDCCIHYAYLNQWQKIFGDYLGSQSEGTAFLIVLGVVMVCPRWVMKYGERRNWWPSEFPTSEDRQIKIVEIVNIFVDGKIE